MSGVARPLSDPAARDRLADRLRETVGRLELDLTGFAVLTEAATGPYVVTPVLAALAGARVHAYAATTRHGTFEEVAAETEALLASPLLADCSVTLLPTLDDATLAAADVVTNSGHLRPLDRRKLELLKPTAVVPLMYESWEWRDGDLDLATAKERGIRVGATNEQHPDIDVFSYLGEMALKLVHDAGLCATNSRFVLVTNNPFGPYLARTLAAVSARVAVVDLPGSAASYAGLDVDWVGTFPHLEVPPAYRDATAVLLAAYPFDAVWIGAEGPLDPEAIVARFDRAAVLRYVGHLDEAACAAAGLSVHPAHVTPGHMGILPSALGYEPIVRLQAGGLKAAEAMLTGRTTLRGHSVLDEL